MAIRIIDTSDRGFGLVIGSLDTMIVVADLGGSGTVLLAGVSALALGAADFLL